MKNSWINKRSRIYWYDQYALNEQESAFKKYDPDRIADELVGTGADIIALYAANQFGVTFYPSRIWPQHPNLKGRDYVGEIMERLHARKKKVILYINWLDSKHPEWRMVPLKSKMKAAVNSEHPEITAPDSDLDAPFASWADKNDPDYAVRALAGGKWYCHCFNSPKLEQALAVTGEIAQKYRPDGFHIDMVVNTDICVCGYCMPELERICGMSDITPAIIRKNWAKYIDWRCESGAKIVREATRILRKYDIVAAHNLFAPLYTDALWGQDANWLDSADIFLSECFDAFRLSSTDLNSTSVNVRWQRGVGKIPWILRTSAPSHYSHWPITEAQWEIYAAASKANGCKAFGPCGVGAYPDTTSPKRLLSGVKKAFDFYMEDSDLDDGSASDADVAVVFSWATRKYQTLDRNDWQDEFNGWTRLLLEEHIHYDVLSAERISSASALSSYKLVILPDLACVSKEFCEAVGAYVKKGGRVLASFETSLRNEKGETMNDFMLGTELGIRKNGEIFKADFAVTRPVEPEPASGCVQPVDSSEAEILARFVELDPAGPVAGGTDHLPDAVTDLPLAVRHSYGKGHAVYTSYCVGGYYQKHGFEHTGDWMMELFNLLLPERRLIVMAPRTVEVTLRRQKRKKRSIIHLANRTVPWTLPTDRRQITEIVPVQDVTIEMKALGKKPLVSFRQTTGRTSFKNGTLRITLSSVGAYAAVVVDPDK